MKYILREYHRKITDKEIITDLRKAAKLLGRNRISKTEYLAEGKYDPTTIANRFGSWNNALLTAGLKLVRVWRLNDKELMLNLKKTWDSLGRQPLGKEMVKPVSKYYATAYARHFGTWINAVKTFVKYENNGKLVSEARKTRRVNKARREKRIKKFKRRISKGMRYDVLVRDKFKCRLCGRSPADDRGIKLHIDHLIPVSKNGPNTVWNLITACQDCNLGKSDKYPPEFLIKLLRQNRAPKSLYLRRNPGAGVKASSHPGIHHFYRQIQYK